VQSVLLAINYIIVQKSGFLNFLVVGGKTYKGTELEKRMQYIRHIRPV
jgi:hypothetical protein